jgi:hypothetical protein
MRNRRSSFAALGLLGLVLFHAGCDSAKNPVAPSGSVLTVTANPSRISLTGQTTITVVGFRPDGNPLSNGTLINLATDLGVLTQTLIEVTGSGRASTTLSGDGTPGMAMVTASLPGSTGEGAASGTAMVQIGETEGTTPALSITVSPSRINIEQTSVISVIARNSDGSRLANGTVSLRASLGRLGSTSLTTDSNGEATTTLTPEDRSGMVTVTGSVGSSAELVIADAITILQTQVIVEASPSTVDIQDSATVTILVRDQDNVALVAGYDVDVTASLGTLESPIRTDGSGSGSAVYTAGERAGMDTITALLANSEPGTATITIRDAPAVVSLDVSPTSFTPSTDGTDFQSAVRVSNAQGEPLVNEIVRFTVVQEGNDERSIAFTLVPAGGPSTDGTGRATAMMTITSNAVSGLPVGTVLLFRALVRDVSSDPVRVTIQGGSGG